nr:uncharacterized protein C1orf100 homolog [Peromyscus maniculatus bairdii]
MTAIRLREFVERRPVAPPSIFISHQGKDIRGGLWVLKSNPKPRSTKQITNLFSISGSDHKVGTVLSNPRPLNSLPEVYCCDKRSSFARSTF